MSKQQELLDIYAGLLTSTGTTISEDGMVVTEINGEIVPVTIEKLPLVLPTQSRLKAGIGANVIAFHPMSENALRGESVVLKKLRLLIMGRVSSVLMAASESLMAIAADTSLHGKLSPKASEFLSHAQKADERTLKALNKVLGKVSLAGDHRLVNFSFKRPGEQSKDSFTRVCNVSFPILDEAKQKEPTIFGVKMRIGDKETILNLFSWLLDLHDGGDAFELYSTGTRGLTAPYFSTLVESYVKVAKVLNAKVKLFKKGAPDLVTEATVDLDWVEVMQDMARFRDIIPALRGNEGAVPNHPGSKGVEMVTTPPVEKAPKLNLNVDAGGSLAQEAPVTPPPTMAPAPQPARVSAFDTSTVTPPQPAPTPMVTPTPTNTGLVGNGQPPRKVKMSELFNNPNAHAAPNMYTQQPIVGAPNGRDLAIQRQHQQYLQSPQAYYNPNVYQQVHQPFIQPQQAFQQQMGRPQPAYGQSGIDPWTGYPQNQQQYPTNNGWGNTGGVAMPPMNNPYPRQF